jgi:hypothetical protein
MRMVRKTSRAESAAGILRHPSSSPRIVAQRAPEPRTMTLTDMGRHATQGCVCRGALPWCIRLRERAMSYRDSTRLLLGVVLVAAASAANADNWALSHQGDPISGEQSTAATMLLPGTPVTGVVITCEPKIKRVISTVQFGTFLSDKLVDVEYRVDQRPAVKDRWLATARGTGVLEGGETFAKGLLGGTTLYFRAYDYHGAGTMLTIPLGGSEVPIGEVLGDCVKPPPDPALAGVDESTIDEVGRWGPHVTVLNKTILARLGFFHDAIDATKPTSLTVAADQYHKKLHEICAAKFASSPVACTNLPLMIEISRAGTKAEQKEYGPLRISD